MGIRKNTEKNQMMELATEDFIDDEFKQFNKTFEFV